jgi:hypothetical protein
MIGNEEIIVSTLLNGLYKCPNGPEIGADFGLGKNGANVHSDDSLAKSFPWVICRPEASPTHIVLSVRNLKGSAPCRLDRS